MHKNIPKNLGNQLTFLVIFGKSSLLFCENG